MKSTRWAFIVVSLITLILLIGSAILQRIVFKAAESQANVFLTPANFIVKPSGSVTLAVDSGLSIPSYIAASQIGVDFDATKLQYQSVTLESSFETMKLAVGDGHLSWLIAPSQSVGRVGQYTKGVRFGTITFLALTGGSTMVRLDPKSTIISAVDPQGKYALYNAVRSVQASVGEITLMSKSNSVKPPELTNDVNGTIFSTQRIISEQVATLNKRALLVFGTRYLSNIKIDYGQTEQLGSVVSTSSPDTAQVVIIQNLQENSQYFYRVSILDENSKVVIVEPIKSFRTTTLSNNNSLVSADKTEILTVLPTSQQKAKVLAITKDAQGRLITDRPVEFNINSGQADTSSSTEFGLPTFAINSIGNGQQSVGVTISSSQVPIGHTEINFDSTREQESISKISPSDAKTIDQKTQLTLAALLAILLLSGLALVRLLKVK